MTRARIRRLRQFRHLSRALGGGVWVASNGAKGADGDDQRRVTAEPTAAPIVPSTTEHLGCRRGVSRGSHGAPEAQSQQDHHRGTAALSQLS